MAAEKSKSRKKKKKKREKEGKGSRNRRDGRIVTNKTDIIVTYARSLYLPELVASYKRIDPFMILELYSILLYSAC